MNDNINIKVGIGFGINKSTYSKTLSDLSSLRAKLSSGNADILTMKGFNEDLKTAYMAADKLENALRSSWNNRIGQLDMGAFNRSIQESFGSFSQLKEELSKGGTLGSSTFNSFSASILHSNTQLKETSKLLDSLATSMGNTIKWGITSSFFNRITGSIGKAFDYAVQLDSSLNDIRIVTGKSADEMERFAKTANKSAQALGAGTKDFTNAALIYYQQGLDDEEAQKRAEITLKTANVTGQSAGEVSEQLTAVWNGYKVNSQEAELYIDKLAAVAATTASDLEELSTGMSKVASAASLMGVDIDQLNAQLATIVSVTRQAPESVGVALKTIYARMGDIEAGIDSETTLGNYTAQMSALGVQVLDAQGQFRDMGKVIEEIGNKWNTYSREQQVALSQIMAGTRQYNNLLSLFDNWDMYEDALLTSATAAGTLNDQQEIYMETTEAHLQKLQTETEALYDILFDEKPINNIIDSFAVLVKWVNTYLGAIQNANPFGTMGVWGQIAAIGGNIFQKQLGSAAGKMLKNRDAIQSNKERDKTIQELQQVHTAKGERVYNAKALEEEIYLSKQISAVQKVLTEDQLKELTTQQERVGVLIEQIEAAKQYQQITRELALEGWLDYDPTYELTLEDYENAFKKLRESAVNVNTELDQVKQNLKELEIIEQKRKTFEESGVPPISKTDYKKQIKTLKTKKTKKQIDTEQYLLETQKVKEKYGEFVAYDDYAEILYDPLERSIEALKKSKGALDKPGKKTADELIKALETQNSLNPEQIKKLDMLTEQVNSYYMDQNRKIKTAQQGFTIAQTEGLEQLEAEKKLIIDNVGAVTSLAGRSLELSDVIGGVTAIWASFNNVLSVGSVLMNNNMSDWDKAIYFLSTLGSTAMMVIPNLDQIKNLLPVLMKNLGLAESLTNARKEIKDTGILFNGLHVAVEAASQGINKSLSAAFHGNILAITGWIGAIALATYGLYKFVEKLEESKSLEGKLTKEMDKSAEAYKRIAEEYQKTKDLYSSYDSAIDSLRGLKQGTIEWYEAITKANKASQELIDKWNLFAGTDYTLNTSGLIEIDEDVLEEKMFKEQQKVYQAQAHNFRSQADYYRQSETAGLPGLYKNFQEELEKYIVDKTGAKKDSITIDATAEEILRDGIYDEDFKGIMSDIANNTGTALTYDKANVEASKDIKEEVAEGAIDITGAVSEYLGEFQQLVNQVNTLELQAADSTIRGYLDKDDVDQYTRMTGTEQNLIQQYVNDYQKNKQNTPDTEIPPGASSQGLFSPDMTIESFKDWWSGDPMDYFYRQRYAENVKGYTQQQQSDGTTKWVDQNGNILSDSESQKMIKGIDPDVAKTAYENGEYFTKEAYEDIMETISTNQAEALRANFGEESQKYIAQAKTAGEKGLDFDYNLLSENELKWLQTDAQNNQSQYDSEQYEKIMKANSDATARAAQDLKNFNNEIALQANELETSQAALKLYTKTMRDANGDKLKLNQTTAKMAAGEYEFNKAYNESREAFSDSKEAYEEWYKAAKNGGDVSYDVVDAVGEVTESLSKMFGFEVDADFMEKHYEDIKTMLSGTADEAEAAYNRIMKKNLIDALTESFGKTLSTQEITDWANHLANLDPGAEMDQKWTTHLINMINSGNYTKQQMEDLFAKMNIQMPEPDDYEITMGEVVGKGSVVKHSYTGQMVIPDGKGGYDIKDDINYSWEETTSPLKQEYVKFKNQDVVFKKDTVSGGNFAPSKPKSSSSKKPKKEKPQEDNKDIYHDVNIKLAKINNELEKIQDRTDKKIGSEWLKNMQEQFNLLNQEIETTGEKIKIAEGEMADLRNKLSGKGITFNADGTISNYASAYDAQLAALNAKIAYYNTLSDEGQENYQETLDNAKEDFEKFVDNIERYDEVLTSLIPGLKKDIQDALDQQTELKISVLHYEVDLRLDTARAQREWNEFKAKILDGIDKDDILGGAKAALEDFGTYFNDQSTGTIQRLTNHLTDIMKELNSYKATGGNMSIYSDFRKQALEDLEKYIEEMMSEMEDLYDLTEKIKESYLDMMDEALEKFDEQLDTYEQISNLIEHDMNLIKLLYGENAYSDLANYYEMQHKNNLEQLEFHRMETEFWKQQMDQLEEGSDEWLKAKESWQEAVNNTNEMIEQSVQNLQDLYLNAINNIFNELNNQITNGKGLEFVSKEWELINQNADEYLDNMDRIYAIQQLSNKYQQAIDENDGLKAQRELKNIMEDELAALREKDKLTQYDIDRAELRYQIALKQIALEEAQQNKTKMRLRRDSQGNYTYQYTADEDQISKLQSEMSELYQQLYNLDADEYKNNLNQLYDVWVAFQQDMLEAEQINDEEAKQARKLMLTEQYGKLINDIVEQDENLKKNLYESTMSGLLDLYNSNADNYELMTKEQQEILDTFVTNQNELNTGAFNNLFGLYDDNILKFRDMADDQKAILVETIIPQWNSALKEMMDQFTKEGGFGEVCKDAFAQLEQAAKDYNTKLQEIQTIGKISFDTIKNGVDKTIDSMKNLITENQNLIDKYDLELDAIAKVIASLDSLILKYNKAYEAAKKTVEEAQKLKNATANQAADETKDAYLENQKPKPSPAPVAPAPAPAPSLTIGSSISVKPGTRWYADSYGGGSSGPASGGKIQYINTRGSHPYNINGLGWVRKTDIVGYATGGYTGDWNSTNGKLALLHQKELVLNAQDTKNMLNAVQIVRSITENLSSNLLNKLSAISANTGGNLSANADTLEQTVHIDAQFPNVTNSSEIEDALNNLVNRAAQHITRN